MSIMVILTLGRYGLQSGINLLKWHKPCMYKHGNWQRDFAAGPFVFQFYRL